MVVVLVMEIEVQLNPSCRISMMNKVRLIGIAEYVSFEVTT